MTEPATYDILLTQNLWSQTRLLRYATCKNPSSEGLLHVVPPAGFEPATLSLEVSCSSPTELRGHLQR